MLDATATEPTQGHLGMARGILLDRWSQADAGLLQADSDEREISLMYCYRKPCIIKAGSKVREHGVPGLSPGTVLVDKGGAVRPKGRENCSDLAMP